MGWRLFGRLAFAGVTAIIAGACISTPGASGAIDWSKVASEEKGGGEAPLIAAARADGKLTVVASPADWATYGELANMFQSTYGITVTSVSPRGQTAFDGANDSADVVDASLEVALASAGAFAPYRVADWNDIPAGAKEPTGLWFDDHGGYMGIGYNSSKVPAITSLQELLGSAFHGKVAIAGDPATSNEGLNAVMMASVANGGSLDDVSKGVVFFHQLKQKGNYVPMPATAASVISGLTPVVFEWDYLSALHRNDVPAWRIFVPNNAIIGGYHSQAINKRAPHPAAARLWEEFLSSDQGQNLWLKIGARPAREAAMTAAGTIDATAAAALPPVNGSPEVCSGDQTARARTYVQQNWTQAIG
jgi:putative spermidine/putrescine transport system substrate-binding protein